MFGGVVEATTPHRLSLMRPGKRETMQATLILAAIFNIIGGLAILFLQGFIAPLIRFHDSSSGLFRMFVGGTAVLFGAAYIAVWQDYRRNRPLLVYGTILKYWAFAISLFGFLTSSLSLQMLLLFGVGNLIFAVLFTRLLLRPQDRRKDEPGRDRACPSSIPPR